MRHALKPVPFPAAAPRLAARLAKTALALLVGIGLGWGAQQGVEWWRGQPQQAAMAADVLPFQPQPYLAPAPASPVHAWLRLGGQRYSLDHGQVALPSGSRFQVEMVSGTAGQLTLVAVNPAGQALGVVWSGPVAAGGMAVTPLLRLQGAKGRESLQILLQPGNGAAAQARWVHLWHL